MNESSILISIIIASLIGGIGSLVGGFFLLWQEKLARRISLHLVTMAAGTLLAVAFLDLLPEAFHEGEKTNFAPEILVIWTLVGILTFFLIELLLIRLHTHEEERSLKGHKSIQSFTPLAHNRRSVPWLVTIGDSLHNFIDGITITAAFLINPGIGLLTTIAIASHEIPQEVSDFSILLHSGWSKRKVLFWNFFSALASTTGALVAYAFRGSIESVLAPLIAFAAGVFIYIASSDLIPDIHHHAERDKPWHIMVALGLGVALIAFLTSLIGH